MKYLKGLTVLASGLCIVGGAFAATTVVDDDSTAKDKVIGGCRSHSGCKSADEKSDNGQVEFGRPLCKTQLFCSYQWQLPLIGKARCFGDALAFLGANNGRALARALPCAKS